MLAVLDGSLDNGHIAVIAGGIDIFYPPDNEPRQRAVAEQGLLLAEMPPQTQPQARHFPHRNWIIAGLAQATLVIEAAVKSGSLITARLAADAGRDVMAIPGSPLDARAQGCNQLIREGATLVQNVDDIIEILRPGLIDRMQEGRDQFDQHGADPVSPSPVSPSPVSPGPIPLDDDNMADRQSLQAILGTTPVPIDELIRQTGLPGAAVQLYLLELDLAGRLDRHAGSRVSLAM